MKAEEVYNEQNYIKWPAPSLMNIGEFVTIGGTRTPYMQTIIDLTEEEIRKCLIEADDYISNQNSEVEAARSLRRLRDAIDECDLETIEENDDANDGSYDEEIMTCKLLRCDWDTIEKFDSGEKVKYSHEIRKCEEKLAPAPEPVIEEVLPTTPSPSYQPVIVNPVPNYTPPPEPVQNTPIPTPRTSEIKKPSLEEPVEIATTSTTTEPRSITVTEEEVEPEPERERPSFIKRIISFLFGWF